MAFIQDSHGEMYLEPPTSHDPERPASCRLRELLLPESQRSLEMPDVVDLAACVTSLARGVRTKALLPLASHPMEVALVRRGEDVLVSWYATGSAPELYVWDRRVSLRALLTASARAAMESAQYGTHPDARRLAVRLAERALRTEPLWVDAPEVREVVEGGDSLGAEAEPLAFGFSASLPQGTSQGGDRSLRADVHALLFDGVLWGSVRGRRVVLARGPILLAAQRMVHAVRALVDAWERGRPTHVRLRAGAFRVAVRLDRRGEVNITFTAAEGQDVTATALRVHEVATPILRLASDLLRALVSSDRSQSRNLRVRSLRSEVQELRRTVRARRRIRGFINEDPDRLRMAAPAPEASTAPSTAPAPSPHAGSLRFSERWRFELDGLGATSVFLCGDRLLLATPRHTAAVGRERGELLWARDGANTRGCMAGDVLLRMAPDGQVELCDVGDGEPFAHTRIAPQSGCPAEAMVVRGASLPPLAILHESPRRLVAVDLRTGELRWRFTAPGDGPVRVRRAGRVLLLTSGEAAVTALDVASGETVWRFGEDARFDTRPSVCGEVVVAAGAGPSGAGALHGIELYSGHPRWCAELSAPPVADPVQADGRVVLPVGDRLHAHHGVDGTAAWDTEDPGLSDAACVVVDDALVINASGGRLAALDLRDGSLRWQHGLSQAATDDVPRFLDPVLRGGALFVPAASVHALRPHDGAPLGEPLPCDLVPDLLRVDERGWVYVAEESGRLAALAPAPRLTLVHGGRA